MAPTICSGKKLKTRILSNDDKYHKRDNFINNTATVYDSVKQQSVKTFQLDENALNNMINNSLPLNLTCNKVTKTSKKISAITSSCTNNNSYTTNDIKKRTRLMHTTTLKHINCNIKISNNSEVPLSMIMLPSSLPLSALRSLNRKRRCSASSTTISDVSSDVDIDDEEFIDDDCNDSANIYNDYQFHIQSIDDKKRRFYNAIISGNFNENDNDAKNTSSSYDDNNESTRSNNSGTNETIYHQNMKQNIGIYEKNNRIKENDATKVPPTSLLSSSFLESSLTNCTHSADDLLGIAIKTIKLVQRNHLLQQRLNQLQLETSAFIESVLNNPENRHFREKVLQKLNKIASI